jgi:hypothetical protein
VLIAALSSPIFFLLWVAFSRGEMFIESRLRFERAGVPERLLDRFPFYFATLHFIVGAIFVYYAIFVYLG